MAVYLDLVMVLNFLVDFLLLLGTNRFSGFPTAPWRSALAALLGALSDAICTVIARIVSSAVNFTLNKNKVFRSSASLKTSLTRYYILAAVILLLSSVSISAVSLLFSLTDGRYALLKTACKFCIDSVLFLISFRAQREWVFAAEKTAEPSGDR